MTNKDIGTDVRTIAVVGLGLLGRGIATCFLGHGFRVIGCDTSSQSREAALPYIDRGLREMIEHAGVDPDLLDTWRDRYHSTGTYDDWPSCDFVVESVAEDIEAKRSVFRHIEQV